MMIISYRIYAVPGQVLEILSGSTVLKWTDWELCCAPHMIQRSTSSLLSICWVWPVSFWEFTGHPFRLNNTSPNAMSTDPLTTFHYWITKPLWLPVTVYLWIFPACNILIVSLLPLYQAHIDTFESFSPWLLHVEICRWYFATILSREWIQYDDVWTVNCTSLAYMFTVSAWDIKSSVACAHTFTFIPIWYLPLLLS